MAAGKNWFILSIPARNKTLIAAMSLAAHLALGLNMFGIAPLLPLAIADYEINRLSAGLLVSLPMLVGAAFGIPGGMLVARVGVRRACLIGWVATGVLTLSFLAPGFAYMLPLRLAYGVGLAMTVTATGPLLLGWFAMRGVLVMNALNTAALSLGVALSFAVAAPLAGIVGWKMALTLFGGLGAVGAVVWLAAGADAPNSAARPAPISFRQTVRVLRSRTVVLLVLADAGVLVQYTALTGWLPTFYTERRALDLSEAGFITGILPLVGIFAVLAGGWLPLRFGSARAIFVAAGLAAGLGGLGSFLLPEMPAIYAAAAALGFGSWFYVPMLLTLPLRLAGMTPAGLAVIYGSMMTFSGIAMFVSPILVGAIRDAVGSYLPGFLVCSAASWLVLLAGLLLPAEIAAAGWRPATGKVPGN